MAAARSKRSAAHPKGAPYPLIVQNTDLRVSKNRVLRHCVLDT